MIHDNRTPAASRRLESSLIGKNVLIGRSDQPPRVYRPMVGDHARVGVPTE